MITVSQQFPPPLPPSLPRLSHTSLVSLAPSRPQPPLNKSPLPLKDETRCVVLWLRSDSLFSGLPTVTRISQSQQGRRTVVTSFLGPFIPPSSLSVEENFSFSSFVGSFPQNEPAAIVFFGGHFALGNHTFPPFALGSRGGKLIAPRSRPSLPDD